jgi:hypothetical protein
MNFLFFISLFAVTVSSNPLSPLFADPKAFVASLQNADPEIINKMLGLVVSLEEEGQATLLSLQTTAKDLRATATQKAADLNAATEVLSGAQGALATATGKKNELTSAEAVEKAALDKAISERDASQADADTKAATKASVTARTTHEVEGFNEVLNLLDDVVVEDEYYVQTGRSLLDAANADPDAIDRIKQKIQDLIDASGAEAQAADDADAAAAADLAAKLDTHEGALAKHTATAGQLQSAIIDVEDKTDARNAAKTKQTEADRISYAANVDADDAESFLASEDVRIADEADTLAEVKSLLTALLPAEF